MKLPGAAPTLRRTQISGRATGRLVAIAVPNGAGVVRVAMGC